jgi:hypothetical protein
MESKFKSLSDFLHSLPEWQDDLRARSMFASFSQPRSVNPEAWDTRFSFWNSVLSEGVHMGLIGSSCFGIQNPEDLPFLLSRNQMTPLGLSDVLVNKEDSFKFKIL